MQNTCIQFSHLVTVHRLDDDEDRSSRWDEFIVNRIERISSVLALVLTTEHRLVSNQPQAWSL